MVRTSRTFTLNCFSIARRRRVLARRRRLLGQAARGPLRGALLGQRGPAHRHRARKSRDDVVRARADGLRRRQRNRCLTASGVEFDEHGRCQTLGVGVELREARRLRVDSRHLRVVLALIAGLALIARLAFIRGLALIDGLLDRLLPRLRLGAELSLSARLGVGLPAELNHRFGKKTRKADEEEGDVAPTLREQPITLLWLADCA